MAGCKFGNFGLLTSVRKNVATETQPPLVCMFVCLSIHDKELKTYFFTPQLNVRASLGAQVKDAG